MVAEPSAFWLVLGAIAALVFGVPLVFWVITSLMRRSAAVKAAVAVVEANQEAMMFLGSPVTIERFVFGRINLTPLSVPAALFRFRMGSGYASLSIPLRGPKGLTTVRAKLERIQGEWRPFSARMWIGSRELVLLDEPPKYGRFKRLMTGNFGW